MSAAPVVGIVGDMWKAGRNAERVGKFAGVAIDNFHRYSPDQDALISLVKEFKRKGGLDYDESIIIQGWAKEFNLPFRGPEIHLNRNFKDPHFHVGPIDHIKYKGGK